MNESMIKVMLIIIITKLMNQWIELNWIETNKIVLLDDLKFKHEKWRNSIILIAST